MTEGNMQIADQVQNVHHTLGRPFVTLIVLPFLSFRAKCKQANPRVIQANRNDIHANWSADVHYD